RGASRSAHPGDGARQVRGPPRRARGPLLRAARSLGYRVRALGRGPTDGERAGRRPGDGAVDLPRLRAPRAPRRGGRPVTTKSTVKRLALVAFALPLLVAVPASAWRS